MADRNYLKQIKVGDTNYDLAAYAIQNPSVANDYKTWTDIVNLVSTGFGITVGWSKENYALTAIPSTLLATVPAVTVYYKNGAASTTGELSAASAATNKIYIIYHPHGTDDGYDEYISTGSAWEKIGNTDVDLSDYAKKTEAAKPGTYTTGGSSASTTAAGGKTYTSSSSGSQTATGSATVTYKQSAAATGASGAGDYDTDSTTINGSSFGFSGNAATISVSTDYTPAGTIGGSASISAHSHTINLTKATVTYVTGATLSSAGAHTHTIDSHEHGTAVTALTSDSSFSAGTLASLTKTTAYAFGSSITNVMHAPTVTNGVLSWTTTSPTTTGGLVTAWSAGSAPSFTPKTATVAGAVSAKTLTSASAGGHTHAVNAATSTFQNVTAATSASNGGATIDGSKFSFTGTAATLSASVDYTPTGSITGSASHTHGFSIADHTHSIALTDTTITGTVAVAVGNHTHTVTVESHTHGLNNHTHSVTINSIE